MEKNYPDTILTYNGNIILLLAKYDIDLADTIIRISKK